MVTVMQVILALDHLENAFFLGSILKRKGEESAEFDGFLLDFTIAKRLTIVRAYCMFHQ